MALARTRVRPPRAGGIIVFCLRQRARHARTRLGASLGSLLQDRTNRNALLVFGSQLARLALGLGASILIARSLGATGLGVFGVLGTLGYITSTLTDFGLTSAGVARLADVWRTASTRVPSTAHALLALKIASAALIIFPAFLLAAPLSLIVLGTAGEPRLLQIVFIGVLVRAAAGGLSALLQGAQQFKPLVASQLANSVVTLVLVTLFALATRLDVARALLIGVIASGVSALVTLVWIPRVVRTRAHPYWSEESRALLDVARWLWLSAILSILALQLDVVLLNRILAPTLVGYYVLALNLAFNADIVQQSLFAVLLPVASGLTRAEFPGYVRENLRRTLALSMGLLLLIPLAPFIIPLLYGSAYLPAVGIFAAMILIVMFDLVTMPLMLLVYPLQQTRLLALADALRVIVLVAGIGLLVPAAGLSGAVLARFLSRVGGTVLILFFVMRSVRST